MPIMRENNLCLKGQEIAGLGCSKEYKRQENHCNFKYNNEYD